MLQDEQTAERRDPDPADGRAGPSGGGGHDILPIAGAAPATARQPGRPAPAGDAPPRADEAAETDPAPEETGGAKGGGLSGFVRKHPLGTGLAALALLAAIVGGVLWYLSARHFETTDDAFIDARVFSVSPKVSGYLVDVPVTDNQHVEAGALIARIDTRDYDVALEQANGQVEAADAAIQSATAQIEAQRSQIEEARAQVQESQAALEFARDENLRAQELVQKGAGTAQRAQQTASNLTQAQATVARSQAALNVALRQVAVLEGQRKSAEAQRTQAVAQRDQAKLNLSYTEVRADQPGRVARLTAARGQLVQAGQALAMFVPDELWVTANFKETQLADMRPGQPVDMTIDAYPDRVFAGKVSSIQRGSGTVFSLLPAQNATGNYVKVVQRVPVKLVFDEVPKDVAIGPGMSVVPKVRVR